MVYVSYIMKRTQIYLDVDQDRRLAAQARAVGATKSTLIREAIASYLSRPDEEAQQLAEFRMAVDELVGQPVGLADGRTYVEELRREDRVRDAAIESRRR